jgi:glucose/mannose transport system substrate-binding protein
MSQGALFLSCGGEIELGRKETPCDFAESDEVDLRLELLTFWTKDDQERKALEVLTSKAEGTGLAYLAAQDDDRTNLQEQLQTGTEGLLPAAFQVNGGSDVLQYIQTDEPSRICKLDPLVDDYDLRANYFSQVLEASSCDGSLYAWPLTIHRLNTMLVNKDVYEKVQERAHLEGEELGEIESLKSTRELINLLRKVQSWDLKTDEGDPIIPLSLGIQDTSSNQPVGQEWVLQVVALENLLISYGEDYYEALWQGGNKVTATELEDQLEQLAEDFEDLGEFIPQDPRSWQQATRHVGEGRALLTIGGDWIRAQLEEKEFDQVASIPYAGTHDVFVFTPDSFAVPSQVKSDGAAARRWLTEVVHDLDTQIDFAAEKQAIPARAHLTRQDRDRLGSLYLRESYERFSECHDEKGDCRLLLAVSGLAPSPNVAPCFDRLGRILAEIAGMDYVVPEQSEKPGCSREMPQNVAQAKAELVTTLMDVSRTPFRRECRSW